MRSDSEQLEAALDRFLTNQPVGELHVSGELISIKEKMQQLDANLQELQAFVAAVSRGDIDAAPPSRHNYLAAPVKQLQAQMRHLTWQTQCVAEGDYNQQVDFMGEFSYSFNSMVQQLKSRDEKIQSQQDFMMRLFDHIEPVLAVNSTNREDIIYTNYEARERFALSEGCTLNPFVKNILALDVNDHEHQIIDTESGRWYSVTVCAMPWYKEDNALLYYCRDITMHKKRESNLEQEANTDTLTGLYNRRALENSLNSLWQICSRTHKPLSILMFDIDNFKEYNDQYGHLQGDNCLSTFGEALRKSVSREADFVARYGGEEFVVLLPFTVQEGALRVAEKIRESAQALSIPATYQGKHIITHITVSGGASCIVPSDEVTATQLLDASDSALYAAKQSGRNRICYRDISASDIL